MAGLASTSRIRSPLVCLYCREASGKRWYSIMDKAKRRAGVPLDLITKRKPLPVPSGKKVDEKPAASILDKKDKGWKTSSTLAKEMVVSNRATWSNNRTLKDSRPTYIRNDQQGQDLEPDWSTIQSQKYSRKRSQNADDDKYNAGSENFAQNVTEHRTFKPRKPAGLEQRLIKVADKAIEQPEDPHFIKVAVIGAPNAGKSSLINQFVGEEVSVVSPKSHTTRERVLAVMTEENHQVAFLDTPGVVIDNRRAMMNRTLATSSWRALDEADHLLLVIDADDALKPHGNEMETYLLEQLKGKRISATLVFNKMDLLDFRHKLLKEVTSRYRTAYPFIKSAVYVSAKEGADVDKLQRELFKASKPGLWQYPSTQTLEMPDLKRVEEFVRVEFFKRLHQYIPYLLKQENMGWTELPDGTLRIDQHVYVERDSQHKIVVGANGRIVKQVTDSAAKAISNAFRRRVKLHIQVKTRAGRSSG